VAIQYPLHRAIFLYKLSLCHQLNCFLICAKSFVTQYLPKIQSKQRLQRFGFTLALKQFQITKSQTLAALKVKPQYNTAINVDARVGMEATDMLGLGSFMLGGATDDNLTGGNKFDLLVGNDTLNGRRMISSGGWRHE
jgi:hypothetical protein